MRPILLLGAQIDFDAHYRRRGDRFYDECDRALDLLVTHPNAGPVYLQPYRRLLLERMPIAIFYAVEGQRIVVHAIMDLRQDPKRIAERLENQTET